MNDFPNELLCNIFAEYVHLPNPSHLASSPITLSHVCRRWKYLALYTPELWTKIIMTFPPSSRQLYRVSTWLLRSQSLPLEILLDFRDPVWDWEEDDHSFLSQHMDIILRVLVPCIERWETFELLTDTWAPIYTFLSYTRRVTAAPLLRIVSLSRCNAYFAAEGETFKPEALREPIPLFNGSTLDSLKALSLTGVHVDWSKSALRGLTELELKYHAREVMPTLTEFTDILTVCPGLLTLAIVGWGPKLDLVDTPPGLSLASHHRTIYLPQLTKFKYGVVQPEYALDLLSLFSLPSLLELELEDVRKTLDPFGSHDATPILEWMTINASGLPSGSQQLSFVHDIPIYKIESLGLHGIHADEHSLDLFIDAFKSLRRLNLCTASPDVIRSLIPKTLSNMPHYNHHTTSTPCPSLSKLDCQDIDTELIFDVLKARAELDSIARLEWLTLTSCQPITTQEKSNLCFKFFSLGISEVHIIVDEFNR